MNFLQSLGLWQWLAAGSFGTALGGFIIKKTDLLKWVEDKIKQADLKIDGMIGWAKKTGYNFGVLITTRLKKAPVIGIFYENTFEPILIVIFNGVNVLIMIGLA